MKLPTRLTTHFKKPVSINKKRILIIGAVALCVLLSGWSVPFGSLIKFALPEAFDVDMVNGFNSIVSPEDLLGNLHDNSIADDIISGVQANLSGNVYSHIEIPEMQNEPIGVKIIKILLDRLFS